MDFPISGLGRPLDTDQRKSNNGSTRTVRRKHLNRKRRVKPMNEKYEDIDNTPSTDSQENGASRNIWTHPISAGRHPARIIDAEVTMFNDEYQLVRVNVEILDAPDPGHIETKWYHLKSQKAADHIRGEFKKIGFEVKSPEDVERACEEIVGLELEIHMDFTKGSPVLFFLKRINTKEQKKGIDHDKIWRKK